jgi:hypothetical protein
MSGLKCTLDQLQAQLYDMQNCILQIKESVICSCDVECAFTMSGFDYETGGFWGSGAFQASVNGVATSTPWAFAGTENKSLGYQAMIDQINATPGWSVSIVNDPTMASTDLVEWMFTYCGDAGGPATLSILRQGGDSITLDAEAGTGSFLDSDNNEISNDRQPVKV